MKLYTQAWARTVTTATAGSGDRYIYYLLVGSVDEINGREVWVIQGNSVIAHVSFDLARSLWSRLGDLIGEMEAADGE